MKINEFIELLKETLEIEDVEIKENTDLKELDEYDSLAVLSIIAMIDENFNKKLSAKDFLSITTVKSLMKLIGDDKFE